jgi:predicted transposase YbfD/YdcC
MAKSDTDRLSKSRLVHTIGVVPAKAAGIGGEWPAVRQICRVRRWRQRKANGKWQEPQGETVYLITSLAACEASPQALLQINRGHWDIEIMHTNKDVILGEDGYTNRLGNAPRNVFSLTSFALKILKPISPSLTRAMEHFQDDRNRAIRLFSDFH